VRRQPRSQILHRTYKKTENFWGGKKVAAHATVAARSIASRTNHLDLSRRPAAARPTDLDDGVRLVLLRLGWASVLSS
jgi:hypothetical protein